MERLHSCWVLEDVLILVHDCANVLAGVHMPFAAGVSRIIV
jgi:hypothetical protein